jgi:cytochrome c biogenesis protein CcmG, thiol:disulfide interchange protein DsbE
MPPSAPHALSGKPLPNVKRTALHGEVVDTGAAGHRVTVIKFFAKYCEPCRRTLPAAQRLHTELSDVVMIGVDEDESSGDAEGVISTYGITFPVVHDTGNVLSGRFRVTDLPVTFVARDGVIRWIGGPAQNEADLADAVRALR